MKAERALILKQCESFIKKGGFSGRLCALLKNGDFDRAFASTELVHILNEGAGKKIKASALTAQMQPILKAGIVKVKNMGRGTGERKFWLPGWLDKGEVARTASPETTNEVLFFTGQNSWSDPNKNFPKTIEKLQGNLCVVDPFYGNGTFDVLEKFGKNRKIRFLSSQLGSDEQQNLTKFDNNLRRFKKEFKNIELRRYDRPYELHDRYVIAENSLVIIGHGMKDLASKESFVIFLPEVLVKKFLPNLKKIFEERWKKSRNIT